MITSKMDPVSLIWNGEYSVCKLDYKKIRTQFLEKWTINKLTKTKSSVERIRLLRLHTENQIKSILEKIESPLHLKSASIAEELRKRGNDYYKKKNLKSALRGYNLSLCFSPPDDGEELTLAFANRSACLLELNRIEDCLQDIELSWDAAGYGKIEEEVENNNVKKKLVERKKKCHDRLGTNESISVQELRLGRIPSEFTLKTINETIPSAEKYVTVEDHPDRGRHVRMTEDVNPGTLLIVEDPFAKVLVKHLLFSLNRCDFCQAKLYDCGIPCKDCVFVMYCSKSCSVSGHEVHQYECQISSRLHNMGLSRILLLALRIVTKMGPLGVYDFWKENVMRLPSDENDEEDAKEKILGFNKDGIYSSSDYLTIFNLIYHDEVLTERELCQYSLESILIIDLLKKHTNYFTVPKYESEEEMGMFVDFVTSLLLLHQMNLPCNAHSLNELELVNYGKPTREEIKGGVTNDYGACAFSLLSLINHSCDPNVTRVTLANGHNAVVAIRKINAGDEVLDNYGPHYAIEGFPGRQKHLKSHYNFECTCVACQFKWPTVAQLKKIDNSPFTCISCRKNLSLQTDFKEILDSALDSKGNCPRCQKFYNLETLATELDSYGAKFNAAYEKVLENQGRESLTILLECLLYFESQLLPPYVYSNYSQETLKQAFNLINM